MILMVTKVQDNLTHRHYAIQFTVALSKPLTMSTNEQQSQMSYCVNPVMQPHSLATTDEVFILLINPSSDIGHWVSHQKQAQNLDAVAQKLRVEAAQFLVDRNNSVALLSSVELIFKEVMMQPPLASNPMEPRIAKAMEYLRAAAPQITSLELIASQVSLSPSRFLHLFKQEMYISYRRFQLWLRLLSSIDSLTKPHSITVVAHDSGFADSAHYSRTFKECFGFTPNEFRKMKRLSS